MHILGPLLRRQLRQLLQHIQVSQHGGQRGADVVGQIQNQLIFPLLRGSGRPLPLIQDAPHRVQFAFKRFHLRRELDLLRLLRQKAVNSLVDLPEVSGHPAEQVPQHQQKDQDDGHAEEDLLVAAEVVMVEVKRLLMGDIQPPLHQPDHQIPAPAFPQKQVQGDHDHGGNQSRPTEAHHDPELKNGEIRTLSLIPRFCIHIPRPF